MGREDGPRYMLVYIERERERERKEKLTWNGSFCSLRWVTIQGASGGDEGKYGPRQTILLTVK